MMAVNSKLVDLLGSATGGQLSSRANSDDLGLQAVRYLTRRLEAEMGTDRWRDERLVNRGFDEQGGWRAMIVKMHQIIGSLEMSEIPAISVLTNEWECGAITARIRDMHANHKLVEHFLAARTCQAADRTPLLVRFSRDLDDRGERDEHTLVMPVELLWFGVQAAGRFDADLESFVAGSLAGNEEAAKKTLDKFKAAQYNERVFGEKFGWYCLVLSQQGQDALMLLKEISDSVKLASINPSDKSARRRLETLLVLMRGHEDQQIRLHAEICMHMFQDGHDWQEHGPLAVSHAFVGERVELCVPQSTDPVVLEFCAPVLGVDVRPGGGEVMSKHLVRAGETVSFVPSRCGFYDFRIRTSTQQVLRSGRVVVQAKQLQTLQLKEVNLAETVDLRAVMDEALESGFSGFLLGNVTSETNRTHCAPDMKRMLKQTSERNPSYIGMSMHVSALRSHRKYRDLFVQRMTRSGLPVTQSLLNYRLLDVWELLVDEMAVWARDCGAHGVRLFDSDVEPPMFAKDLDELLRKDEDDGRSHFEILDMLAGVLVKSEISAAISVTSAGSYGSAFFVRTLREIWRRLPTFSLLVDATADTAEILARSGVVPVVHGSVRQPRVAVAGPSCLRIPDEELQTAAGELWAVTGPQIPIIGKLETPRTRELQHLRRACAATADFVAISNNAWAWRSKTGVTALTIFIVNHDMSLPITKTFPLKTLLGHESTFPYFVETGLSDVDGKALWASEELEETEFELTVQPGEFVVRLLRGAANLTATREKTLLRESMMRCGTFFQRRLAEALEESSDGLFQRLFAQVDGVSDVGLWRRNVMGVSLRRSEWPESVWWSRCVAMLQSIGEIGLIGDNELGSVAFVTPEIGKWSTAGGLGVMVDELSTVLGGRFLQDVLVISPYYDRNTQGESGYLEKDGIRWILNIDVYVGDELVTLGVHEGRVNNVRLVFLHNAKYLPVLYPAMTPLMTMSFLVLLAKGSLEVLRRLGVAAGTVVTNDWATGLVAAYGKRDSHFGSSRFLHIVHNLDPSYEGRVFPNRFEDLGRIHHLPTDLLVDPHWATHCLNPSRCALLSSDQWGTVSRSYRDELLAGSPLNALLKRHARPFAHPNGIPLELRLERLKASGCMSSQPEAKRLLQKKYFDMEDPSMVLLGFVGRITQQKGVHMIVDIAEQIIRRFNFKIQIFVAGKGTVGDPYSEHCVHRLWDLRRRFPRNFWADPNLFFRDGPLLNLASEFGLMPSMFEPGGIVQQEFFLAGTPVVAFKTGGLKDTVKEFFDMNDGNGLTFESYSSGDFAFAVDRALKIHANPAAYEKLRENARRSVVTCEMVGRAWLGAMCDLHGKFFVDKVDVEKQLATIAKDEVEVSVSPAVTGGSEDDQSHQASSNSNEPGTPRSVSTLPTMSRVFSTSSVSSVLVTKKQVRVLYRLPFGLAKPHNVVLCGSFDNWGARYPMVWDVRLSAFAVELRLSVGTHAVKVVTDGVWRTMSDYPVVRDDTGNENNLLSVS